MKQALSLDIMASSSSTPSTTIVFPSAANSADALATDPPKQSLPESTASTQPQPQTQTLAQTTMPTTTTKTATPSVQEIKSWVPISWTSRSWLEDHGGTGRKWRVVNGSEVVEKEMDLGMGMGMDGGVVMDDSAMTISECRFGADSDSWSRSQGGSFGYSASIGMENGNSILDGDLMASPSKADLADDDDGDEDGELELTSDSTILHSPLHPDPKPFRIPVRSSARAFPEHEASAANASSPSLSPIPSATGSASGSTDLFRRHTITSSASPGSASLTPSGSISRSRSTVGSPLPPKRRASEAHPKKKDDLGGWMKRMWRRKSVASPKITGPGM